MQHLQKTWGRGALWLTSLSVEDKPSRGGSRRRISFSLTHDKEFLSRLPFFLKRTGCVTRRTFFRQSPGRPELLGVTNPLDLHYNRLSAAMPDEVNCPKRFGALNG